MFVLIVMLSIDYGCHSNVCSPNVSQKSSAILYRIYKNFPIVIIKNLFWDNLEICNIAS